MKKLLHLILIIVPFTLTAQQVTEKDSAKMARAIHLTQKFCQQPNNKIILKGVIPSFKNIIIGVYTPKGFEHNSQITGTKTDLQISFKNYAPQELHRAFAHSLRDVEMDHDFFDKNSDTAIASVLLHAWLDLNFQDNLAKTETVNPDDLDSVSVQKILTKIELSAYTWQLKFLNFVYEINKGKEIVQKNMIFYDFVQQQVYINQNIFLALNMQPDVVH